MARGPSQGPEMAFGPAENRYTQLLVLVCNQLEAKAHQHVEVRRWEEV